MSEPLKFTSDADWLRELSRLEHPFGSAPPREIREKAERLEEIADKLDALHAIQRDYNAALLRLDAIKLAAETGEGSSQLTEALRHGYVRAPVVRS